MKKILTIIIVAHLILSLNAQSFKIYNPPPRHNVPQWVVVTGTYTASIILDAMADGYRDEGNKPLSHALEAASIGVLVASPFVIDYDKNKWGYYLSSYVTLRFALFDYSYNLTRGLPLNYKGSTSAYDDIMSKMPNGFTNYAKGVSFIIGFTIPINQLNTNSPKYKRYNLY